VVQYNFLQFWLIRGGFIFYPKFGAEPLLLDFGLSLVVITKLLAGLIGVIDPKLNLRVELGMRGAESRPTGAVDSGQLQPGVFRDIDLLKLIFGFSCIQPTFRRFFPIID
jgi:hypothetical protein